MFDRYYEIKTISKVIKMRIKIVAETMATITDTLRAIKVTTMDTAKERKMNDIKLRFNFTNLQ